MDSDPPPPVTAPWPLRSSCWSRLRTQLALQEDGLAGDEERDRKME